MTERQLKKLGRTELLEILLAQSREMDDLKKRMAEAEEKLRAREAVMAEADSLAAATAQLNQLIKAAQEMVEQLGRTNLGDENCLRAEFGDAAENCREDQDDTVVDCREESGETVKVHQKEPGETAEHGWEKSGEMAEKRQGEPGDEVENRQGKTGETAESPREEPKTAVEKRRRKRRKNRKRRGKNSSQQQSEVS